MKSGKLNFLEPSGPLQACNGTALRARLYTDSSERSGIHILSSAPYVSSYLYGARYKLQVFYNYQSEKLTLLLCSAQPWQ